MKQNLITTLLACETLQVVMASITGVTYMDHFDFEQRYRDVNECNPFYWHPLPLPNECLQMFENLIRSKFNMLTPYRVVKERSALPPAYLYPYNYIYSPILTTEYKPEVEYSQVERKRQRPSQYETLYELLKRDVQDLPSAPILGVSPYLGVIAMYKQPVSYKSAAMIKKLARAYDNSDLFTKTQSGINSSDTFKNNEVHTHTKNIDGNVVVDSVFKGNDAITLLKIKKFH